MRLAPGEKLGPYEIASLIGKGGMGEVFRATDTRLGRQVAVKVSSQEFNDRFEREARAISALNHPNICTLYDIGPNYLVMEFVEGEMLSKMLARGPLPLDKALAYGVQIVDALAAAHAGGIVHRDLKPGNIIIGRNGAKVLDFGLAKLRSERTATASAEEMVTVTEPITRSGAILGTLYYMSPEQVEGKDADERSDIFSFGVVLYEMITGQRPFNGDTQAAVLASLMKDQPPPMRPRYPAAPRALERLVRKCLEKKRDDRWQTARDLKPALELIDLDAPQTLINAGTSASAPIPEPPLAAEARAKKPWLWPAVSAAALVGMAAVTAWALWLKPAPPARATRFEVTLPAGVDFDQYVSVSPDGRKLVFNATGAQSGLWIRDLDTLEWRKLPGTEGSVSPFWSPDSRFLAFGVGNDVKKIEVAGGPVQTLCTSPQPAGTGTWSREGVIVFGPYRAIGPMRRVSASGGVPVELTTIDNERGETANYLPSFLPDGKHFLYLKSGTPEVRGIYAASIDSKPAGQPRVRILENQFAATFVNGNLFFMRDGTLMVQPLDAQKLQLRDEPVPVVEHVATTGAIGIFSMSSSGVLAYRTGATRASGLIQAWFDRQGKLTDRVGQPSPDRAMALSPDGTRAAGRDADNQTRGDIWLLDFSHGIRSRLTFRQSPGSPPIWSPDGSRIIFASSDAQGTPGVLYEKPASGAGDEKELFKGPGGRMTPTSWSRDGRFLLYQTAALTKSGMDLWVLPLEGNGKPALLLGTVFNESNGVFSPDGRWVAYESNESGRDEIYVRPFVVGPSGPALGEGKWQVSRDGGGPFRPKWRGDGKEIVFFGYNRSVMAVEVDGRGAAFQVGTPTKLFTATPNGGWDMTANGTRFLMTVEPDQGQQNASTPITVVLNWQGDLKK